MMLEVFPRANALVSGVVLYRWDKSVYAITADGTHLILEADIGGQRYR